MIDPKAITEEINSFLSKDKKDVSFNWGDIYFIVAEEFGWTEKQLMEETSIPYFLELMEARYKILKKREAQQKRKR